MRTGFRAAAVSLALLLPAGGGGDLAAQVGGVEGVQAFTNARIIVSPERTIERGTVLIRGSRIAAVGPDVAVPEGAVVINLEGRTIHAGLMDLAFTGGVGGADLVPGRPTPSRSALDVYDFPELVRSAWRGLGFTVVGLAFGGPTDPSWGPGPQYRVGDGDDPLMPGRISVVNLGSGSLESELLRVDVAVQVGAGTRKVHEYPVTGMGSDAFVRQVFLDAGSGGPSPHASPPLRAPRPREWMAELEFLGAAARGEQPVWLSARHENALVRALSLGADLGLDLVLLGAQEAWRVLDLVVASGRPVIASLAFPEPAHATGRNFDLGIFGSEGRFDSPTAVDARIARDLRQNPARLRSAGVNLALSSYGLDSAADVSRALMEVVEAGLPPAEALRALTTAPASILGLTEELGTVEVGKLANLVILRGDPFTSTAAIEFVLVRGERHATH